MLEKLLFADRTVVIGAEDRERKPAICVPIANHRRAEIGKKGPGAPLEDVKEGTLHRGKPCRGVALVEDDERVRVCGREFGDEEDAGDVEDALLGRSSRC